MNPLPPSLDRFGEELESAVRRDLGTRRRRRYALRGAVVLAVAAAVALGVLSALPTGGPSVVKKAAAALAADDDSILHYQMNAVQDNGDGTTATWSSETWQLLVSPYTRRQIQVDTNAPRAESVASGDTTELYDSGNNTIYITTSQQLRAARTPTMEIVSKSRLQKLVHNPKVTAAYRIVPGTNRPVVVTTKAGAKRFLKQFAREAGNTGGAPEDFRSDILALLKAGKLQVVGHVTVDGSDAIKLESPDGKQIYIVDASTYDPIEWTTTGTSGGVTMRFPVYEKLPLDDQSQELLSLQAQHPGAQVVRDVHAYMAAESRLYPHG
jgi:outer membrane lipoprotein-sorting protein